tara:strand:- start:355 stop:690 length:336 start_codon:yes stop_codon:yes gene_type:complete
MGTETIEVGLCAGRHEMPVKDFIWQKIDDPMDFQGLENHAKEWLKSQDLSDQPTVKVYVTGLTVALTSFLNAWEQVVGTMDFEGMRRPYLWLLHYDRNTDTYQEQNWLGWS